MEIRSECFGKISPIIFSGIYIIKSNNSVRLIFITLLEQIYVPQHRSNKLNDQIIWLDICGNGKCDVMVNTYITANAYALRRTRKSKQASKLGSK